MGITAWDGDGRLGIGHGGTGGEKGEGGGRSGASAATAAAARRAAGGKWDTVEWWRRGRRIWVSALRWFDVEGGSIE